MEKENESSKFQFQCLVKLDFFVPRCVCMNTGKQIAGVVDRWKISQMHVLGKEFLRWVE